MRKEDAPVSGPESQWTVRHTQSLCPDCLAVIPAELVRRDGQVFMQKTCPNHGPFTELISTNADFYQRLERLAAWECPTRAAPPASAAEPAGPQPSQTPEGCPNDCGLCPAHLSRTVMANIDLTNRCNLRCPICFASSDARGGHVFEVSRAQVREMMNQLIRVNGEVPACVQFSGGEPTLHPELVAILADAQALGFPQIQIATNGLRLAREPDFARACSDAGLNIIYLQFDGLSDEVYARTRARPLLEVKLQAIENCFRAGIRTTLVPTIARGVNDHQIGPILQFALDNLDKIAAVSWQPIAFTGRIDESERVARRFTLADLARCLETQTGLVTSADWFPYSFVEPFSRLTEAITGQPAVHMSCHAHCGAATYLLSNPTTHETAAITQLVDAEALMLEIDRLADAVKNGTRLGNRWRLLLAGRRLRSFCRPQPTLTGWDAGELARFLESFVNFGARYPDNVARMRDVRLTPMRTLLLAAMHFQDVYNFEVDRARRCVVHHVAPDGRLYPFCTYNSGPYHRHRIEPPSRTAVEPAPLA